MEETKLQDAELEKVAGGIDKDGWATVTGLHKGFLALRTQAGYQGQRELQRRPPEDLRRLHHRL